VTRAANTVAADLPDHLLIARVALLAQRERHATVDLIVSLAEFDSRSLYLGQGCSSMFTYCTQVLHLSEHAAYGRIAAARASRRFPAILEMLSEGAITLTTVTLLAPHLRDDNHQQLLNAARHKSKREVELLAAAIRPQLPVPPSIRKLPTPRIVAALWYSDLSSPGERASSDPPRRDGGHVGEHSEATQGGNGGVKGSGQRPGEENAGNTGPFSSEMSRGEAATRQTSATENSAVPVATPDESKRSHAPVDTESASQVTVDSPFARFPEGMRRSVVAPLSAERYRIQFTASWEMCEKLRRAQDLLRHSIPDGDPAAIFERALTLLLEHVERTKLASTGRPRRSRGPRTAGTAAGPGITARSRHIPAAVRREVWARDGGQCAFSGMHGRCTERGFLEFHHVLPHAAGGKPTVDNIQLRCRAHNAYEAREFFGEQVIKEARDAPLSREPSPDIRDLPPARDGPDTR
jgi:hypothetical protein